MILPRRDFLRNSALVLSGGAITTLSTLAEAKIDGRLRNRLDLWANYAGKTHTLSARYMVVRESALLYEPLSNGGTLAFVEPSRLVIRDDGTAGSMTTIEGSKVTIRSLVPVRPPGWSASIQGANAATTWLATHLLALFGGPDRAELLRDARPHVPRGPGYRLELRPPRNSAVRKVLRGLTVRLDPVEGAVLDLIIAEAQGDVVRFAFSDLRQNVDASELEPFFRTEAS